VFRRYTFEQIKNADLEVGSIYEWGPGISTEYEPLKDLLFVRSTGGFRPKKRIGGKTWEYAYVVLYSTGSKEEWPDDIDSKKRVFTYFGDNKKPREDWKNTPGNRVLEYAFSMIEEKDNRQRLYPFLFFTIVPNERHAQFRGLAVPGHPSTEAIEELSVVEGESREGRFYNYKATFSLLNIPVLKREFVNDLLEGDFLSDTAPDAWLRWIETGEYDLLPASYIELDERSLIADGERTLSTVRQHQMIREAAESIEGIVSSKYIQEFIGENYPGTNLSSIQRVIRAFTVNNEKRIVPFPENQKSRIYDRRYDILYQPVYGTGEYELYYPMKHGYWPIVHTGTTENKHGLEVKEAGLSLPKPDGSSKTAVKESKSKGRPAFPDGLSERMEYDMVGSSIVRNQDVVDWVKTLEDDECQICGYAIELPDGTKSIDLHHIWPLGKPHFGYEKGYDRVDNAICLCPNHHREMHVGLFFIEPETYRLFFHDETNEFNNSLLRRNSEHELNVLFLDYHRDEIFNKRK
jgi:hypothetical protein